MPNKIQNLNIIIFYWILFIYLIALLQGCIFAFVVQQKLWNFPSVFYGSVRLRLHLLILIAGIHNIFPKSFSQLSSLSVQSSSLIIIKASEKSRVQDNATQSGWRKCRAAARTQHANGNISFSPADYVNTTRSQSQNTINHVRMVWLCFSSISLWRTHLRSKANQLCLIIAA